MYRSVLLDMSSLYRWRLVSFTSVDDTVSQLKCNWHVQRCCPQRWVRFQDRGVLLESHKIAATRARCCLIVHVYSKCVGCMQSEHKKETGDDLLLLSEV